MLTADRFPPKKRNRPLLRPCAARGRITLPTRESCSRYHDPRSGRRKPSWAGSPSALLMHSLDALAEFSIPRYATLPGSGQASIDLSRSVVESPSRETDGDKRDRKST